MSKQYYVYIVASQKGGTLYIGVTSDLNRRIWEHKEKAIDGFTKKYNVNLLVYYEIYNDIEQAIHREKRLKKYTRKSKLDLINKFNSEWEDLYFKLNE